MICLRQLSCLICAFSALLVLTSAVPDSAGQPPLPGPGLSYGGIPYGSVSGNVAEYFKQKAPSLARSRIQGVSAPDVDFAPIEQWL